MRNAVQRAAFVLLSCALLLGAVKWVPEQEAPPPAALPDVYVSGGYAVSTEAAYDQRSLDYAARKLQQLYDRTEYVVAEIQLRTIAMDFWASLEHDIRYKVDKTKLPGGINEEMFDCAEKIAEIDRQMQDMYRRIKAAEKAD